MEIVFLGTGGGRFNLISQVRRTGGFRINGPLAIHVDPGPGALAACHAFSQDPKKTDLLIVTHNHIDHVNDAGLMVEAMTLRNPWKGDSKQTGFPASKASVGRGAIISSKSVLVSDEYGERAISTYHTGRLSSKFVAKAGQKIEFSSGRGKALIVPIPVLHDDKTGFGFVLAMSGKKIGYTSDTEYSDGLPKHYAGCDVLIINNLKSKDDGVPGHLYGSGTIALISKAKPRLAVLTHFGMSLIRSGPGKEAKRIAKATGSRVVAAKDGMKISLDSLAAKMP